MRLLLIRHAQTPYNITGALDTAYPGAELTELGQRQARALPGGLDQVLTAGSLPGVPLAGIYASPLVRTQLTGQAAEAVRASTRTTSRMPGWVTRFGRALMRSR